MERVLLPFHVVVAICYFLLFFFVLNPIGWLIYLVDTAMVLAPERVRHKVREAIRQELKIDSVVQVDAPGWLMQVLLDREGHSYSLLKSELEQAGEQAWPPHIEEIRHQVEAYESIPKSSRVGMWRWDRSSWLTRMLSVWWGIDPVLQAQVRGGYGPLVQHHAQFSGLFVALFGRRLERSVRASLEAYNHTFKTRAEQFALQWR